METVKVYSPVEDKKIRENFNNSPIWTGNRYHIDELSVAKAKHATLYEYSFKFDGTKLIQFTGVKKLEK
jgi:hypothetical protein